MRRVVGGEERASGGWRRRRQRRWWLWWWCGGRTAGPDLTPEAVHPSGRVLAQPKLGLHEAGDDVLLAEGLVGHERRHCEPGRAGVVDYGGRRSLAVGMVDDLFLAGCHAREVVSLLRLEELVRAPAETWCT